MKKQNKPEKEWKTITFETNDVESALGAIAKIIWLTNNLFVYDKTFGQLVDEEVRRAYNAGYKQGVEDELKCIETSGEHEKLKKLRDDIVKKARQEERDEILVEMDDWLIYVDKIIALQKAEWKIVKNSLKRKSCPYQNQNVKD